MKTLFYVCILSLVALAIADTKVHSRGCIYILGRCVSECEEGTHSYTTACGPKTPEPTCENPNPEPEEGNLCDYSACYCDSPTVRDPHTNKCVRQEDCTKN